ncbi:MAG: peptidylprolyl isomerase [Nanoarchaeota archaeon]|nr:peptidylprolyl isomerase [Nanoarchaeota archaeon]MBU1004755.1 peptidylprolyl isomerase [Nanoarchaeota archaeon]MBU1945770.1 peptidylprolyl isomerase [Nanoarchaeota archaeon]
MEEVKEKDFVELEYTGKLDDNSVFDTTDAKVAKDNNLFEQDAEYAPIIICVGQGQIIKGLDRALVGKETEKDYKIKVSVEEAYGKKNAKLIQLIPTNKFLKQNIQPMPGLQVNIDGMMGLIKTVSGGRTLVDFNHPLSGKELNYDIKIKRIVKDDKEKIISILKVTIGLKDAEVKVENNKASIETKEDLPKEIKDQIINKIKESLPGLDEITIKKSENIVTDTSSKAQGKQEDLNTGKSDK